MNRWLLLLLAIVGGAIVAYIAVIAATGAIVGMLWIFVFGDNPWPKGWEVVVAAVLGVIGVAVWFVVARRIWLRFRPTL